MAGAPSPADWERGSRHHRARWRRHTDDRDRFGDPECAGARLLGAVVRRFLRDRHVVNVALAEPRRGDADELRVALQLAHAPAAAVAHPRTESADELMDHRGHGTLVGHASLDPLGYQLFSR